MNILKLINSGCIVSPISRKELIIDTNAQRIYTKDKSENYQFVNNEIPVLLKDGDALFSKQCSSERMKKEYNKDFLEAQHSRLGRFKNFIRKDYHTPASEQAFNNLTETLTDESVGISIGGGPNRAHPLLYNINIGYFPNVDIIADAHSLPFANDTVDFIHCDAVLEHLQEPSIAVQEMFRALKPGCYIYSSVPFLQPYHGYPNHFQNFTLTGHKFLYEKQGFRIIESGTCVGPIFSIAMQISYFIRTFIPRAFQLPFVLGWEAIASLLRPFDLIINKSSNSYILASTTYVVAQKRP
jgi:hypothetical protein